MRKEVLLAVAIGLILGLIITYGIYRAKVEIAEPPKTTTLENIASQPANLDIETDARLTILDPLNESVQTGSEVLVRGTTVPDAHIVILVGDASYITEATTDGEFSITVELVNGANVISITSLDSEGEETTQFRTVVVSDILETNPIDTITNDENTNEESEQNEE